MKNILLLVPRMNIGGAETYVYTVASELLSKGFKVFIASGGGKLAEELGKKGVKLFFLPIRWNVNLSAFLLQRIVRKYNIDLIHSNSTAAGFVAAKVKRSLGTPVVHTAHGIFSNAEYKAGLCELDRIICVSEYVRLKAINEGAEPEKLITCYSGIDLNKFKPDEGKRGSLRKEMGLTEDAFVLAIVSRIKNIRNKGHEAMLKILETKSGAKNWNLLVIGKGKGLLRLKYEIKQKNLTGNIQCLGHLTNVNEILNCVDVVVLPSGLETFGLVLAEAMAMKKPVVAYAVGGIPELINEGKTGFLVEKGNIDELYTKLAILSHDLSLCKRMGEVGRALIEEKFSCEKMMDELLSTYQSVQGSSI